MKLVEQFRAVSEALQFTLANLPTCLSPVRVRRDIAYGSDSRHTLDVHAMPGAQERPVVIFWYGGGWITGSKAAYRFVGNALARCGYCAILPDYRLYPAVRFPGFIEDAAQVVAFVRQKARDWGGNPSKIILMGHSAGAHLAAMVAFNRSYLRAVGGTNRWISAFVGLSGPYAVLPDSDPYRSIFGAPYQPEDWQPISHVDDDSPPSLLLQGACDRLLDCSEATRLRDALLHRHVEAEAEVFPSASHEDLVAALSPLARRRAPTLDRCARFINRIVGRSQIVRASATVHAKQRAALSLRPSRIADLIPR
jgi:acetyl esterase/lipase